jgi:hypothetical protein
MVTGGRDSTPGRRSSFDLEIHKERSLRNGASSGSKFSMRFAKQAVRQDARSQDRMTQRREDKPQSNPTVAALL